MPFLKWLDVGDQMSATVNEDSASRMAYPGPFELAGDPAIRDHIGRVLVVGHAGGIGLALASLLRASNVEVLGIDRRSSSICRQRSQFQSRLRGRGSVEQSMKWIDKNGGLPSRLAITIGTYHRTVLRDYTEEKFRDIMNDNFAAIFWIAREAALRMAEGEGGRIVIVSSQAGVTGGADPVYAAAKAATIALSKSIAREFGGEGVRCNIVAPGPVDTEMARTAMSDSRRSFYESAIPIRRFSTATEVAGVIMFLLAGNVDAVNGATFDVDGGLVRR
jgi:3-oxoacyl-[acyl-carrier protein] reductase